MKRITDYFKDPVEALLNPAMVAYVEDSPHKEIKDGRSAMVLSTVTDRSTLDVTDLLPYVEVNTAIRISHIDGAIPPWVKTLVEYQVVPGTMVGDAIRTRIMGHVTRVGYVILRMTVDQLCALYKQADDDDIGWARGHFDDVTEAKFTPTERYEILTKNGAYARAMPPEEVENIGWYLICFPFILVDSKLIGPIAETHVVLYRDGRVVNFPTGEGDAILRASGGEMEEVEEPGAAGLAMWNEWINYPAASVRTARDRKEMRIAATGLTGVTILPALFAFSMANFRNIYTRSVDPAKERRPRHVQRELVRRDQVPTERYHVLEIGPIGTRRANRVLLSERLNSMPLHMARGHYAYYGNSPEHPYGRGLLFGKYEGKFWIESHMRGSKNNGIVVKDYIETEERVKAVKELTRDN